MCKFFIFDIEKQSVDEVCRIIKEVYEQERKSKTPSPSAIKLTAETPAKDDRKLLTANELAKFLKVPVSWIYQRTRLGSDAIPHIKLGKYLRFDAEKVLTFFKSNTPDN